MIRRVLRTAGILAAVVLPILAAILAVLGMRAHEVGRAWRGFLP